MSKATLTNEEVIAIARQVAEGKTLVRGWRKNAKGFAGEGVMEHGSSLHTRFKTWATQNPEIAARIRRMSSDVKRLRCTAANEARAADNRAVKFKPTNPRDVSLSKIDAAIPRRISGEVRDEITQRIAIDLLEGRTSYANLPERIQWHSNRYFLEYADRHGPVSLDAAFFDSPWKNGHDIINEGLWQ